MEPYYLSWEASPHNQVACIKCHFKPGIAGTLRGKWEATALLARYLTNTYSPRPFAHIEDASCLQEGCHVKEKLGPTQLFMGKAAFNHKPHFAKSLQTSLTCTSCHSPLKGGKHISVNEEHCYLCHLRDATKIAPDGSAPDDACVTCHPVVKSPIERGGQMIVHTEMSQRQVNCRECHSRVVRGEGLVAERTCYNCHDFSEKAESRAQIDKVHAIHVSKSVECFLCHDTIVHALPDKEGTVDGACVTCHMQKHGATELLYAGTGGIGVTGHPALMHQGGVDCFGCHRGGAAGKGAYVTIRARCVECHGNDKYAAVLDTWRDRVSKRLTEVTKLDETVKRKKIDTSAIDDARHNLYLVREGRGIHNVGYALTLLDNAAELFNTALGNESLPVAGDSKGSGVFWFTDTEGLAPVRFDHLFHRRTVKGCGACHGTLFAMKRGGTEAKGDMTMSAIFRGRYCGACHDGTTAPAATGECNYCHKERKSDQ
jgi:c(7)-type cytochrome triheme protein